MRQSAIILFTAAVMSSCMPSCSCNGNQADENKSVQPIKVSSLADLEHDSVSLYDDGSELAPDRGVPIRLNHLSGRLAEVFNDSNHVHWAEASRIGIEPLGDTRSHWQLRRPLVKVTSCADFYVEPLTFSRPYMIPEGAAMLHEIGRRFRDTLQARGGGDYRIKVTSVLRTPDGVRRLRRHNRNAVDSSVHQLGTTVDISYVRFIQDSPMMPRGSGDLKNVLAEVLYAMRQEGKCWVKYEIKQPCFHITVRGNNPPR